MHNSHLNHVNSLYVWAIVFSTFTINLVFAINYMMKYTLATDERTKLSYGFFFIWEEKYYEYKY